MPHISIKAEKIFEVAGFPVTNSVVLSLMVTCLFFFLAQFYYISLQKEAGKKNWLFYLIHGAFQSLYDLNKSILKEKTPYFFGLLGAIFFFVAFNSWSGLIPGVGSVLIEVGDHGHEHDIPLLRAATADLNTTLALAILAVVLVQYYGLKYLGVFEYMGKFINFKSPIDFIVGLIELLSEFSKIISFSFRLFGNIFAGEVMITIIASLIPVYASFITGPIFLFEYFVGFIQALVFMLLTAVFTGLAMTKEH